MKIAVNSDSTGCYLDIDGRTYLITDEAVLAALSDWASTAAIGLEESQKSILSGAFRSLLGDSTAVMQTDSRSLPETWNPDGTRTRIKPRDVARDLSFFDVLHSRNSIRDFKPLTVSDIATLLFYAARVRSAWIAPDGYVSTSRPTPSAGGRHPSELIVAAHEVIGLDRGLYWYDPYLCEFVGLSRGSARHAERISKEIGARLGGLTRPPVVIIILTQPERTLSRYHRGEIYLMQDSGAFLTVLHLVATALEFPSCPVGLNGDGELLNDLGLKFPEWTQLGALACGAP